MSTESNVKDLFLKLYDRGKNMKSLEEVQAIRYDLDRYQHIIDVVKSRKERDETPLLDSTEIEYVMKQLADARGTIAYYRKRNSDPSGRW